MGSDASYVPGRSALACFNPRSRVGSDGLYGEPSGHQPVSIHAPAWGATCRSQGGQTLSHVSIHAPAWGATRSAFLLRHTRRFQSTLPRGERPRGSAQGRGCGCFNPRSRVGSDLGLNELRVGTHLFQSTLPRGERPDVFGGPRRVRKFQSTLPRGERLWMTKGWLPMVWFQSTLPRGERRASPHPGA